jgi:hypothetical protein
MTRAFTVCDFFAAEGFFLHLVVLWALRALLCAVQNQQLLVSLENRFLTRIAFALRQRPPMNLLVCLGKMTGQKPELTLL